MLLSVILMFLNISFISSFSLMDLQPLVDRDVNLVIYATLTDKETSQVWTMEEKLSSKNGLKGKIDITSLDDKFSVFYSYSSYDNNKRLVIHDNECYQSIYSSDWKPYLAGIKSKFINQILLIGPSVFYRLSALREENAEDAVIRGIKMSSAKTENAKYRATFYYKTGLSKKIGVKQPSRVVLDILNDKKQYDTFMLDIYFISQTTLQLDKLIHPTPGIGCPDYLIKNQELPVPSDSNLHFIFEETINESKRVLKEIHVDENLKTVRSSEITNGSRHIYVYDYNIGVSYHSEPFDKLSSCSTRPIELTDPGVAADGRFSVTDMLWLEGSYKYLGDVYYEHRANFKTLVWESVDYDKVLTSGKYDKVVTTQYLAEVIVDNESIGYTNIGSTRNAYNKQSSGKFILVDSIRRNFYEFGTDIDESAYQQAFQISDCFPDPDQRLTLTFMLTCEGTKMNTESCIKASEDIVYELRQSLVDKIAKTYQISFLRTAGIEFVFNKESIKADITFLKAPSFKDSFKYSIVNTDIKSIKVLQQGTIDSDEECLRDNSLRYRSPRAVIYCENSKDCISTENEVQSSPNGIPCKVYEFPLKNLYRFGSEVSLENLHDSVIKKLGQTSFSIRRKNSQSRGDLLLYKIVDIIVNEAKVEQSRRLFNEVSSSKKLINVDGLNIISIPGIASFGDCYRTCLRSEDISCEIFTFCQDENEKQCILTNMTNSQISNHSTADKNCKTFAKSHLSDYSIKRDMKFTQPLTIPAEYDLERCASDCFALADCFSFEYSHGFCSFGGYFSEEKVEPASGSDIYISKASRKYELTGLMIVSEVLHTRFELDIDECAALCDDWESKANEVCKSFNFCPKGVKQSACQITAYSVKDHQTPMNKSDICRNYETKSQHLHEGNSESSNTLELKADPVVIQENVGYAFLILIVGLILGFSVPCLVIKVKSSMVNHSSPADWTKQIDNDNYDDSDL